VDIAITCGKPGFPSAVLPILNRQEYLFRGREILLALKQAERFHANQDGTHWFDQAIHNLGEGSNNRFKGVAPPRRNNKIYPGG
jgi:hypothetical protein